MLLLAAGASADIRPQAPAGYSWEMVDELSDQFDGGQLDVSKWQPFLPYWQGRPPSRFSRQNVIVEGGMLVLRSTSRVDSIEKVANPATDIWVDAACMSSLKPIARHGYYEARIKASTLPMTSSFWLQGDYSEIDVVEQRGDPVKNVHEAKQMHSTVHYFYGPVPRSKETRAVKAPLATRPDERFYVYGVWWQDEDTAWFYLDGKKVGEIKLPAKFAEPLYMIFDTEVWAEHSGLPTVEALGDPGRNAMLVDWVRCWRLVPQAAGKSKNK